MQIDSTIIVAVISGASAAFAAIIVAVIQSRAQHNKTLAEMDKRDALQEQLIKQLTEKVEKHNNLVERTYALEQDMAVHAEQISVANHRISDLEQKHG